MLEQFTSLISSVGFPIACVIALGYFAWYLIKQSNESCKSNMEKIWNEAKEREDKLSAQIERNQEVNAQFADIIAKYDIKLDEIKRDVEDIKEDITELKPKD